MLFERTEERTEDRGERMAARSLVAEVRSIVQVYEVLSGLLDGPESARRSAEIFMSDRHYTEEIERIRRRYEERTGEPLLLRYRGEACRLERGKIAVISDPTPGREVFGIVVSDLAIDSRMVDYMWRRNIFCEPLDQSLGGGTEVVDTEKAIDTRKVVNTKKVVNARKIVDTRKIADTKKIVDTRFGRIELVTPESDVKRPEVTSTAGRGDTEAWMLDRSPGSQPVLRRAAWRGSSGKWSNYTKH